MALPTEPVTLILPPHRVWRFERPVLIGQLDDLAALLGAELSAELELQTRRDTTVGPAQPMGERGAYVADHVAGSSRDPV